MLSVLTWLRRSVPQRFLARFADDRSGSVAIMFGLMCILMLLFIGGAIDIGRWLHARTQTASALDSAVLAGGQLFRIERDEGAAKTAMERFYTKNTETRLSLKTDATTFQFSDNYKTVTGTTQGSINTPFLAFANVPTLPINATATAVLDASGENEGTSLEVSMMLDITGSMAGDKISDLKDAAKDLVNIVIWEDQSEYTAKVALAPFSAAVDAGDLASKVAIDTDAKVKFRTNDKSNPEFKKASNCVAERTGANKFTDVAPTANEDKLSRVYTDDGKCAITNPVIPLTSVKTTLTTAIDGYRASGSTAGHLGTAWAWYLLSPNWADAFPADSKPASYSDMTATGASGQPKLKKIAVLMTDGEYNIQYYNSSAKSSYKCGDAPLKQGVVIQDKAVSGNNNTKSSCNAANGNATTQARSLCSGMKTAGIEVYTVGFQLGNSTSEAYQTLSQCATDADHFYNTSDGAELKQAFRDIAIKISPLRLSN